jgi:hypothetical protein
MDFQGTACTSFANSGSGIPNDDVDTATPTVTVHLEPKETVECRFASTQHLEPHRRTMQSGGRGLGGSAGSVSAFFRVGPSHPAPARCSDRRSRRALARRGSMPTSQPSGEN